MADEIILPAEEQVSFTGGGGSCELAGTLTQGAGGTRAAAVLVAGSGPLDRDVAFADHALFRTLAHALARRGIATLRFDKRGVGASTGDFAAAGPEDLVADATAALNALRDRSVGAGVPVGLVGHSEGAVVALAVAGSPQAAAFCVALAGPFLAGWDNAVHSFARMACGGGGEGRELARVEADLTALLGFARSGGKGLAPDRAQALAAQLAPRLFNERTRPVLGAGSLGGPEFLGLLASPFLANVLGWEPARLAPAVRCPVLAVYGGRDVQVPARENLAAARHLADGHDGGSAWTLREFPRLNHLFQHCRTGMPDEYAALDHVMVDEVVDEVARWIGART